MLLAWAASRSRSCSSTGLRRWWTVARSLVMVGFATVAQLLGALDILTRRRNLKDVAICQLTLTEGAGHVMKT